MTDILDIDESRSGLNNYAGFGDRFLAALIDGLIMLIPIGIFYFVSFFVLHSAVLYYLSSYVIPQVYEAYFLSSQKATIGKKVMGIQVVSLDGQTISFANGLGRAYGKIISSLILLIGYFMVLWDDKKQSLHDKMASTIVIKSK